jgi:hypothetical protein
VEGPYTSRHRSRSGSLWTPIIEGDEILVEVFVPTGVSQPFVEIGKVNYGYRGFGKAGLGLLLGGEGTCEKDMICPEGNLWRDQIRAVGLYHWNGIWGCTGTLLNNHQSPPKPYFLSANHCFDQCNDYKACASSVVVYWNFESATCGTHGPGPLTFNQTGAFFLAKYEPSDFLLLELQTKPESFGFHVFYSGWDARGPNVTQPFFRHIPTPLLVGIHHPMLDVKAISGSNSPPKISHYQTDPVEPCHWRVVWNSGVTEIGSSGSCLFEATKKRCIGQLHGGGSKCSTPNSPDYYGMLSKSWNGGGRPYSSLKYWLDRRNTGILFLNGHN